MFEGCSQIPLRLSFVLDAYTRTFSIQAVLYCVASFSGSDESISSSLARHTKTRTMQWHAYRNRSGFGRYTS